MKSLTHHDVTYKNTLDGLFVTAALKALKMTQNEWTATNPIDHTVILRQSESHIQISGMQTQKPSSQRDLIQTPACEQAEGGRGGGGGTGLNVEGGAAAVGRWQVSNRC